MSGLQPKADMTIADTQVGFGPKADILFPFASSQLSRKM
jgi:hypothetical protein